MKQLLSLQQDYFLVSQFKGNIIKGEKGNQPEWIDEKKEKAKGKNIIQTISVMVQKIDINGYSTNTFDLIYLNKADIIELAKRINEIESTHEIGYEVDNSLPF